MHVQLRLLLCAALLLVLQSSTAQAVITHFNVDTQTGGGPAIAELDPANPQSYDPNTGIKTFSFLAKNNGATPLSDVRFLLQFFLDVGSNTPLVFNDATDTWTLAPQSISFVSSATLLQGANGFLMSDTDAPTSFPPYGTISATDTVPQVLIGNIPAFSSVPFVIQANLSSNFVFDGVGSLVALESPIPEPSTVVLLGLGATMFLVARRRFRKS